MANKFCRESPTPRRGRVLEGDRRSNALVLFVCVRLTLRGPLAVSQHLMAFVFGCLACIGVGYPVVSTRSSPVLLSEIDASRVRRRQYGVGLLLGLLLASPCLVTEPRTAPSRWMSVPCVFLNPVLPVSISKHEDTHEGEQS